MTAPLLQIAARVTLIFYKKLVIRNRGLRWQKNKKLQGWTRTDLRNSQRKNYFDFPIPWHFWPFSVILDFRIHKFRRFAPVLSFRHWIWSALEKRFCLYPILSSENFFLRNTEGSNRSTFKKHWGLKSGGTHFFFVRILFIRIMRLKFPKN